MTNIEYAAYADKKEITPRLVKLIDRQFPMRGRFKELGIISGINANRWRNLYYGKQLASFDMTCFWARQFPNDRGYLFDGKSEDDYQDFSIVAPSVLESSALSSRLLWVVQEWVKAELDNKLERVFSFLEEKSKGSVSSREWAQFIIGRGEPSIDMVETVLNNRPHFSEWVIVGKISVEVQIALYKT